MNEINVHNIYISEPLTKKEMLPISKPEDMIPFFDRIVVYENTMESKPKHQMKLNSMNYGFVVNYNNGIFYVCKLIPIVPNLESLAEFKRFDGHPLARGSLDTYDWKIRPASLSEVCEIENLIKSKNILNITEKFNFLNIKYLRTGIKVDCSKQKEPISNLVKTFWLCKESNTDKQVPKELIVYIFKILADLS